MGVWPGEDPQDVYATDDSLRDRNAIWIAERTNLDTYGFKVVKTTANARYFIMVLPGTTGETIHLLRSLMERLSR